MRCARGNNSSQPIGRGSSGQVGGNNKGTFRGIRAGGRGSFEAWGADYYGRNLKESERRNPVVCFHCQNEGAHTTTVPVASQNRNLTAELDCIWLFASGAWILSGSPPAMTDQLAGELAGALVGSGTRSRNWGAVTGDRQVSTSYSTRMEIYGRRQHMDR